jgi:hypothetical protein
MPPSNGKVEVFTDSNYGGAYAALEEGDYVLRVAVGGVGNDSISSLKVASGWVATVYDNFDFTGESSQFTSDTPTLGALNDKISAIRVTAAASSTPAKSGAGQQVVFIQPPS